MILTLIIILTLLGYASLVGGVFTLFGMGWAMLSLAACLFFTVTVLVRGARE